MVKSILSKWFVSTGLNSNHTTKRRTPKSSYWCIAAENLEDRALLSAAHRLVDSECVAVDPAPALAHAHVAHAKSTFTPPNVKGNWSVVLQGLGQGTAVLTEKGATVKATVTLPTFGKITISDKFESANDIQLVDQKKIKVLDDGKPLVTITINFPEGNADPTTFTGSLALTLHGTPTTFNFTGTKA